MSLPAPGGAVPGRPVCKHCGAPLSPHEAVKGVCGAPRCQMRRVQQAGRAVFQRDWQSYVGKQRAAVRAAAPELGAAAARLGGVDTIAFGVVPHQNRAIVAQPEDRRRAFAENLDEIVAKAFGEGAPDPDLLEVDRGEAGEDPLIDATCATCQGKCCILGGPAHAFLTANNIQRLRLRNPGIEPSAAKAHYMALLPERSVEHSCLYHTERGCALDRADRGDICNAYHCNPQTQLLLRMRELETDRAVIVANEGDAGPRVATYTRSEGWRPVDPSPAGTDEAACEDAVAAAIAQIPPDLPQSAEERARNLPTCDWCGQPIDPHSSVTTRSCGRDACESRRMQSIGARVEEQKHERYLARQRKVVAASVEALELAATALDVERDALVVGVVPHQDKPVEPPSAERRAAFEAHLRQLAAEAFAIAEPETYHDPAARADLDARESPIVDACCATCQGSCCTLGHDTHAFLDKYEVSRFRMTQPDATPDAFVAYYMARIPEASVRDACIYQTAAGCALPRSDRAAICNSFRCKGVNMLVDALSRAGADRAAIIAHRDERPQAAGTFSADGGWRPLIRARGRADQPG